MNFDTESLRQQIPYYLTAEDKRILTNELKEISQGGTANYLLSPQHDSFLEDMLQGDGWEGFYLFKYPDGKRISVRGLVLSNSCDINPDNSRDVPSRVLFAPLVKLSKFEVLLRRAGIAEKRISEKLNSIRTQKTTNIFFLPGGGMLSEDYIVRFDETQSMPAQAHSDIENKQKLFTLSNTGFYMLVFKLSIHFCRLHENVDRKNLKPPF